MPPKRTKNGLKKVYGVWVHPDSVLKKDAEPDIGEYRTWRDWKLERELEQRGIPFPSNPTKGNMAKALRKHDEEEEVFGPGPYSNLTTPANSPSSTGRRKSPVLPHPISAPRIRQSSKRPRNPTRQPPESAYREGRFSYLNDRLRRYIARNTIGDTERNRIRSIIGDVNRDKAPEWALGSAPRRAKSLGIEGPEVRLTGGAQYESVDSSMPSPTAAGQAPPARALWSTSVGASPLRTSPVSQAPPTAGRIYAITHSDTISVAATATAGAEEGAGETDDWWETWESDLINPYLQRR